MVAAEEEEDEVVVALVDCAERTGRFDEGKMGADASVRASVSISESEGGGE